MPSVFPISVSSPVRQGLRYSTLVADFGDGYEQRVNKNQAYSRADGLGGVTSYKGRNRFSIRIDLMKHANGDPNQDANKLWAFYQARLGGYEAFYFYNPTEAILDPTGTATTGRYLVRFEQQELERENFFNKLYRAEISLIETRV